MNELKDALSKPTLGDATTKKSSSTPEIPSVSGNIQNGARGQPPSFTSAFDAEKNKKNVSSNSNPAPSQPPKAGTHRPGSRGGGGEG